MEGGGHASSDERGAEKSMDDYLKSIGLHRKKIAKDGSCLFRAVAEQVLHCQSLHIKVRAKCVEFLKKNRASYEAFIEGDFEDYLFKLQDPQQWVGEVEISALAAMYKRDFLIFQEPGKPPVNITDKNFKDKVQLCFLNGNHYDSVYPISHIKNSALCQSILYELLYDGVFRVERGSLGMCQRVGRPSDLLTDDGMAACPSSDESDVEADEPLWVENGTSTRHNHSFRGRGRGRQLPERVRRSLNPTLFRNIEYDFWHKTKRAQQKMDYCIAAGMQYTVGDRCQVRHEGRSYNATVKEVPPNNNNNMVVVHIEELGKRHVPLWSLRPPSEEGSWSTVVKEKRLSNGHGDWEERGKGRGRGKPVPPSPTGSQVAVAPPGSSGRVQKQHSWSPQANVVEQGGDKPTRKSVGLLEETLFNVMATQEETNQAMLEIELRDENGFPALGSVTQSEGGKRKGGEKRRSSQRHKMKSPEGDVGPVSPSAGQSPKSSTPSIITTAAAARPTANTTTPTPPPSPTPACAAPAAKPNTPSLSPAAAATVAPSTKPCVTGGAPPHNVPCSASVFSFLTPVLPTASAPPSLPAFSSSPKSSTPPPTFIAPIAPSPVTLPPSSLHRSSLPHSPSPPSSSSLTLPHHAVQTPEAPAQSLSGDSTSQSHSVTQLQHQTESLPQTQASLPQTQASVSHLQPQSQTHFSSQSQSEMVQVQPTEFVPGASFPHPHLHTDPPQQPHLSLGVSASPTHPCLQTQSQTDSTQPESAVAPPPPQQPVPAHFLTAHPPHPPHPPHPQSIPGAVPLHKLSQLYQDPLYPGFPQEEKGDIAPVPPLSNSRKGDDLPRDLNILRFFFNLGVKAFSMPLLPPYLYLLPLQQAYTLQPRPPSRSPSPTPGLPPSGAPSVHQESYTHYPPVPATSVPPQYGHQAPPSDTSCPNESSFNQMGFSVPQAPPHRMPCSSLPWQHHMAPPTNSAYPLVYSPSSVPYQAPPPQGYHPGLGTGHPLYPPTMSSSPYPPSSLAYQPSSTPEDVLLSQVVMEQRHTNNGDTGSGQVPGPLEGLTVPANVANSSNSRAMMVPGVNSLSLKNEQGESLTRTVLLVDPPINNRPILALVSDDPVSLTTMKPSRSPAGSPSHYSIVSKATIPGDVYHVHPKHFSGKKTGHMLPTAMTEMLSVSCSTEDTWEESEGFKPSTLNSRGHRRIYRGGARGRGGVYEGGRGGHRRRGEGFNHAQFGPSHRGRGY